MNRHQRRVEAARARANPEGATPRQRANAQLLALVEGVHAELDEHQAKPVHNDGSYKVSCTPGCEHAADGCCRMIVLTELSEAQYIVARNPDAVKRALPRLIEHTMKIARHMQDHEILSMWDSSEATQAGADAYWELDMPCAFLDLTTNKCTVYEHRPIPCRTHFVISPPADCAGPARTTVTILEKGTGIRHIAPAMLVQRIQDLQGGSHTSLSLGPLPLLVLHAIGHPLVTPVVAR